MTMMIYVSIALDEIKFHTSLEAAQGYAEEATKRLNATVHVHRMNLERPLWSKKA